MGISGPGGMWFEGEDGQPVKLATAYLPVSHDALVDTAGHVCGPECPPLLPLLRPTSWQRWKCRVRLVVWRLTHLHEYRIVHRSRIGGEDWE